LRRDSKDPQLNCFLYGVSPAIRALDGTVHQIAPTDIPVLLIGEPGTGREEIALEIHRRSRRCKEAFLKFDCHNSTEPWNIALSSSGTVLFDDVDRLPLIGQDRLFQLLGDDHTSARLISATAQNLEDQVRGGRFRDELYYKINGICLLIPALRHRPEDIPELLELFLKKYSALSNRPVPQLNASTMDPLIRHAWPGNVSELACVSRNIVELRDERLALSNLKASNIVLSANRPAESLIRETSRNIQRELILNTLNRVYWNRRRAARELKMSYRMLLYKLKQLGLGDPESASRKAARKKIG
jgi:DNA-binding NtrC family response regulator